MSRIGKQPIPIPEGVTVEQDGAQLVVSGPKGTLKQTVRPEVKVSLETGEVLISRKRDDKFSRSLHGLTRALIANLITGVTEGFSKTLKIVGTGYRVKIEGENLILSLGFSHPVVIDPVEGIKFEVKGDETITISGIDKALVGQIAAKIRAIRPPEPYKGKGIRYEGETVKKKPGKAGKVGAAGFGEGGQ